MCAAIMTASFAGCSGGETTTTTAGGATTAATTAAAKNFDTSKEIGVISREDGSGTRGAFIELFGIEKKNDAGEKIDYTTQNAVITDKRKAIERTLRAVKEGVVESETGTVIPIAADTICIHGDNPAAVAFAAEIHAALEAAGVTVCAL